MDITGITILKHQQKNAFLWGISRFLCLSHIHTHFKIWVCVISLSSVKTLVCSNYFCHLLPTVANYCTNSLQGSNTRTQTHTFANMYTVCKSICKYHVTGQCPITWGQRGRGPAAWLDTTRDGQIANRLFLTRVIRKPDRTRRAGAAGVL